MKIARNEKGFTLIELMVVLIIIGILAAIAIPTMSKQTDKAKIKRAVSELKSMKTIMDIYVTDTVANPDGKVPASADAASKVLAAGGVTQFTDPWGSPYQYLAVGEDNYSIWSRGAKKADGGDDDIYVQLDVNPTENGSKTGGGDLAAPAPGGGVGE